MEIRVEGGVEPARLLPLGSMHMDGGGHLLQIRLLGGLRLVRHGQDVALPASKKTRALLGYLIATAQPHRRERLCDLLWDGPDDPRGELRWSMSKLRRLLHPDETTLLQADRQQIGFVSAHVDVDLMAVRSLVSDGVAAAPTERLRAAAALFQGELLDGLDLPMCYRYQEWCIAEREAASRQHRAILTTLLTRLTDQPEDALSYARTLVAADPLAETGHAAVIGLLDRLGRKREALAHFGRARRVLESELGVSPGDELTAACERLHASIVPRPPGDADARQPLPERPRTPLPSFVGRRDERTLIERIVAAAVAKRSSPVLLVSGEPGIGKSRLLADLATRMTAAGGVAYGGCAFEAEAARPYGIWIDVVRAIIAERSRDRLPRDLGLLLPELGTPTGESGDQGRLFDGAVDLLRQITTERPVVLTLDDLQWIDEASCALLHYVVRQFEPPSGLLLAVAARAGEIDDNPAAACVIRSLSGTGRLRHLALAPLSAGETAELVRAVAPRLDPRPIVAESAGNPLFATELARAAHRGDAGAGRTIELVVAGQLARLRDHTRDLLVWAAALGRGFTPERLARITGLDVAGLVGCLDELERHGLIRPTGEETYDFGHDLIRHATYRSISQPRRTLVHRQIARAFLATADDPLAGDAAHHAALGNDHELAARACVVAGERALRLFANGEAGGFADRGARHVERLPWGPLKVETAIALLNIRIMSATGPGLRRLPPIANDVAAMTAAAEAFGLHAPAMTGHYLLSVLYQEAGDLRQAEKSSLRAAETGRITDQTSQVHQLANTARCLVELEARIPRSRALVAEAESIAHPLGIKGCELDWARGLLHRWDGELIAATRSLQRALALAQQIEDRRREYKCLTWLAMLAFERGRFDETRTRCAAVIAIATQLGDDDTPFAMTLLALAALRIEEPASRQQLEVALQRLRIVDDKSHLAYALNAAAGFMLRAGDLDAVGDHAREALTASSLMHRHNDMAIARALLARIGDEAAAREIERHVPDLVDQDKLSARARASVRAAAAAVHLIPTRVPTLPG